MTSENQSATQGDVKRVVGALAKRMDERFEQVDARFDEFKEHIDDRFEEVMRHFDVVAEKIHDDVAGANKDEISFIKEQKIPQLEKRVEALEQRP